MHAVSRIKGKGDLYEMDVLLDVNTDLYPMEVSTNFAVAWIATWNDTQGRLRAQLIIMWTGGREVLASAVADA